MNDDTTKIIIEHFDDRFATLLENVETIIDVKLKPIAEDVSELRQDMKIVKTAVQATNQDVQGLQQRAEQLEAAA